MDYEETRLNDIYVHLQSKGIDVYFKGQHNGDCLSNYVVIATGIRSQYMGYSSTVTYYDIMCYVPQDYPSTLDSFLETVEGYMKELYPMIKFTGTETQAFYDDTCKGHMRSAQYSNYRKM